MDPSVITTVTAIAATQHGAITTRQLRGAGVSARAQQHAAWLTPVEASVCVVAGSADTLRRRLLIGLLALGGAGWVSHEAAAALHRFDRSIEDAVEFTVPRAARRRLSSGRVHTTDEVGRLDVVTKQELRCTSATRTIIDLAHARIPEPRLEAAIDSAVRMGLSAPLVLERRLSELRGKGRWGARALDRLLIDSGGESLLERRFLQLVREAGLPRPVTQRVQRRDGRHVARVDFHFAEFGVIVEVTGRLGHSTPTERGHDAQRRNELIDLGLKVYEYTWAHVTQRRAWVVATLRERLTPSVSTGST